MIGGFYSRLTAGAIDKKMQRYFLWGNKLLLHDWRFYSRLTAGAIDKKQVGMIINSNLFRLNDQF